MDEMVGVQAATTSRKRTPKFPSERLQQLVSQGLSQQQIADSLGTSRTYVCRLLKKYNIEYLPRPGDPYNPHYMYDDLYRLRNVEKKTANEIGKILGISPSRVYYRLRKLRLTGANSNPERIHDVIAAARQRIQRAKSILATDKNANQVDIELTEALVAITRIAQMVDVAAA
jgi:DNA-binding CsgD family transcriptional regulator